MNIALLKKFEVQYVECANDPLGAKHNAGLRSIVGKDDLTHFMVLPSDDLVSMEWVKASKGYEYATVGSCAMLDPVNWQAKTITTEPKGRMRFGACRVFSRAIVERLGYLWTDHRVRALDMDSDAHVRALGYELELAQVKGPAFVDIKTSESLWGYDTWSGDPIAVEDATWMCSDRVKSSLALLRSTPS